MILTDIMVYGVIMNNDMTINTNEKIKKSKNGMTLKYLKIAEDLMNDKTHPLPCTCAACLYAKHLERLKGQLRKKYEKLTFFVWWLMIEIKTAHVVKKKKSKIGDLLNAPYLREAKKVLRQLPELKNDEWYYLGLEKYIENCFKPYLIKKRYYRPKFLKLINELESEIGLEWRRQQPDPPLEKQEEWKQNWGDLKFAQKVADFIYSQHKEEVPQQLVLRKFNNYRESDLERVRGILKINYNIDFHLKIYRGRKTGYYSKGKYSRGRYWEMGN